VHVWLPSILGAAAILLTVLLINQSIIQYKLVDSKAHFVAILYLILASSSGTAISSPLVFGNLLFFFALNLSFSLSTGASLSSVSFWMGAVVSLAGLLYYPFWLFLPVMIFGMFTIQPPSARAILIALLGWSLPIFYYIAAQYIFGSGEPLSIFDNFRTWILTPADAIPIRLRTMNVLFFMAVILAVAIGIMEFTANYYTLAIIRRKNYRLVLLAVGMIILLIVTLPSASIDMLACVATPLAFLVTRLLDRVKHPVLRDLILLGLIANIVALKMGY
jgi:hypothetical protein